MNTLNGQFKIKSWQEQELDELASDGTVKLAQVEQEYTGALLGSSRLQYQICYLTDSLAEFVGTEYFSGHLDGNPCELIFHHQGRFEQGKASSQFCLVKGDILNVQEDILVTGVFNSTQNGWAEYQLISETSFLKKRIAGL